MIHQVRRSATLVFAAAVGAIALTAAGAAATTGPAGADRVAGAPGGWGTAEEVPGTAALNHGNAILNSVSCASPGNCGAGGYYQDGSRHQQALVASETNGTWRKAEEVPGIAALNQGGYAQVVSVSCASAGNCSAGGSYLNGSGEEQVFVVREAGGAWRKAEEIPGTRALNTGGSAVIRSLSCASVGNCVAAGYYTTSSGGQQAMVVSETNGTWRKAHEVPGTAALNEGAAAAIYSVSCASAGNCTAGGYYFDGTAGHSQAFVVSESKGTWQKAKEVPGTAVLNRGGAAAIDSVSCASPGNCGAGGYYTDGSGHVQALVVSEVNGRWHNAREVPGTAALNRRGNAAVDSLSCASAGSCSAGGHYQNGLHRKQAFVVIEAHGIWRDAREVPGTAALNRGRFAAVDSVSCASAGNCGAGGYYADSSGHQQAFVVSEVNGTWHSAEEVPGTAALNRGHALVGSVSCASAGECSAGGYYIDGSGLSQAFVVGRTPSRTW